MDVRIGYSVDLEEVPERVADMLSELSLHKAGHLASLATEMIGLGHYEVGLTLLESARLELGSVDRGLNEAQMILSGYKSAKERPTEEPIDKSAEARNNPGEENVG